MDSSQNAFEEDTLMTKLDETERRWFYAGQGAVEQFERWERGQSHKLTASSAIVSIRKRKSNPASIENQMFVFLFCLCLFVLFRCTCICQKAKFMVPVSACG